MEELQGPALSENVQVNIGHRCPTARALSNFHIPHNSDRGDREGLAGGLSKNKDKKFDRYIENGDKS